jgi:short-subunit dehydrogenase
VHALALDLTDAGAAGDIAAALMARGLYCDVLVNNAGLGLAGPAVELDLIAQLRLLDVNVRALAELSLRFLPEMMARGRGGILNLGSILGYTPGPYMALYHASKAFVGSLSAALAAEAAGTGVTVTNLSPGVVRTPFLDHLPLKHMRAFKLMPRSDAVAIAQAGWRGFRRGKRLVIPRLIDRLIAGCFLALPDSVIPRLRFDIGPIQGAGQEARQPAIVVTGASSGIGQELARVAARDGSFMVLVGRSRKSLDALASELNKSGARALALHADLRARDAAQTITNFLAARGLYCEVLVNSAGLGLSGPAARLDASEQMDLVEVDVRALTDLTLRFLPGMVVRGRGGVLNLGSIAGFAPGPYMAMYYASKAYVRSFSAALAMELSGTGVTVTNLSPGVVRTAFFKELPVKRNRLFKLLPRSSAAETAEIGWRGFRAGKRLIIPQWADRAIGFYLRWVPFVLLPRWNSGMR